MEFMVEDRAGVGRKGEQPRLEASTVCVPWPDVESAECVPPLLLLPQFPSC